MTTREIYFKCLMSIDLPVGIVYYTFMDKKGMICLGHSLWFEFKKELHEENIKKMQEVEKMDGFMFWNMSPEGEEFIRENKCSLAQILMEMIENMRFEDDRTPDEIN